MIATGDAISVADEPELAPGILSSADFAKRMDEERQQIAAEDKVAPGERATRNLYRGEQEQGQDDETPSDEAETDESGPTGDAAAAGGEQPAIGDVLRLKALEVDIPAGVIDKLSPSELTALIQSRMRAHVAAPQQPQQTPPERKSRKPKLDKLELDLDDDGELAPAAVKAIRKLNDHYAKQLAAIEETLGGLDELDDLKMGLNGLAEVQTITDFERTLEKMPAEIRAAVGDDLTPGSETWNTLVAWCQYRPRGMSAKKRLEAVAYGLFGERIRAIAAKKAQSDKGAAGKPPRGNVTRTPDRPAAKSPAKMSKGDVLQMWRDRIEGRQTR